MAENKAFASIDAESDQHQVVAQVAPVDHDDREVPIAQRCRKPLRHLLGRHRYVAARHRALRGRTFLYVLGQRLRLLEYLRPEIPQATAFIA
jgi:hypothetical protein